MKRAELGPCKARCRSRWPFVSHRMLHRSHDVPLPLRHCRLISRVASSPIPVSISSTDMIYTGVHFHPHWHALRRIFAYSFPRRERPSSRDIQLRLSQWRYWAPPIHNMGPCSSSPGEDPNAWKQFGPEPTWEIALFRMGRPPGRRGILGQRLRGGSPGSRPFTKRRFGPTRGLAR
jgi:hypothetical protein